MPMFNVLAATVTSDTSLINIGAADTTAYALLGYAVVFTGLVALIIVITIMAKIMVAAAEKKAAAAPAAAPVVVEEAPKELAKGSAGDVKLFDVPDRDAAMIMAIVANQMKKPLNELRFKSIKEVK
ncbi:MAG: OadG family transporter subunit [Eubacteriales bacterium]